MALTCSNCGNERDFQVKTLQMHIVQFDGDYVGISDEEKPAVLEVLCDECEAELDLWAVTDDVRREVLHTLGAQE